MPDERGELPCDPAWVEGVIANGLFLYHPIEAFTSLRYVQLTSASFDRMPMDYAAEKGITVHNARGVYSIPMAEFALASVLAVYKQADHFRAAQDSHRWDKHRGLRELYGKRVTVVGCGSIGTECAIRFSAMGCRVVGADLYPRGDTAYEAIYPVDTLSDGLPQTDILVLTLPLTDATRHLIGREELAALPDGAVVVNISRGGVLDTDALTEALSQRELYAVLDVFEQEPVPPEDGIWTCPNLLITPHTAGNMTLPYTLDRIVALFLEDLDNYCAGRPLLRRVDPRKGY
jgi:phosphoglycerate dehydrogenase-like enzyme